MTRKWRVLWYGDPYWGDGNLTGKIEISDEMYDSVCISDEPQVEFFVSPDLKIIIDEIHDDDEGHWKGMPKYIESQIKREAKQLFKAKNVNELHQLMQVGKVKVKNIAD